MSQNEGVAIDHLAKQIGAMEGVAKVTLARDLPFAIERAMGKASGP